MGKWGKWIVLAAVLLILAPVLAGAVYILRIVGTGRQIERKLAEIEARGEPVKASDLMDSGIPDSENAARLYDPIIKEINRPTNNRDFDLMDEFISSQKRMSTQPTEDEIRTLLARHWHLIEEARSAAAMQQCRYKVNWSEGYMADLPHQTGLKRLALLARLQAHFAVSNGQLDEAVDMVILQIKFAESLKNDPCYISHLIRYRILKNACYDLNDILNEDSISTDSASELAALLKNIELNHSLVNAIICERAIGITLIDQFREGTLTGDIGEKKRRQWQKFTKNPIAGNILAQDELFYLNQTERTIDVIHLPYRLAKPRIKPVRESEIPKLALMSVVLLNSPERMTCSRDNAAVHISLAQIALALDQYKQKSRTYPASLQELNKKIGWQASIDPFSGKGFIYKPKGTGYVLYSVDEDFKDNGGKQPDPSKSKKLTREEHYDIVWEVNR